MPLKIPSKPAPKEFWYHQDFGRVRIVERTKLHRKQKEERYYRVTLWPVRRTAPGGAPLSVADNQILVERVTLSRAPWPRYNKPSID